MADECGGEIVACASTLVNERFESLHPFQMAYSLLVFVYKKLVFSWLHMPIFRSILV